MAAVSIPKIPVIFVISVLLAIALFSPSSAMAQSLNWSYQTGGLVYSSPAVDSDGTIYIGSADSHLYALNPDGTRKWRYQTGGFVFSSPAIDSEGNIYIGSYDNYLYALNPDGTLKWSYQAGGEIYSSSAISSDGTIYFGSWDGHLYALNSDGTLKWKFQTGDFVDSSPAIDTDGTVYVGSYDMHLYALNPDGTLKWKFNTGNFVGSSPAIGETGSNDVALLTQGNKAIFVGSGENLFAVQPDGTEISVFSTGDPFNFMDSSPTIASGSIIGADSNGNVYAVSTPFGSLASSDWPKFGNNLNNTAVAVAVGPTNGDGGLYVSESPRCKCECPNGSVGLGMHVSIARGTLSTDVPVCRVESAQGPTIDFSLHYDSGKADGSVAKIQTVLGPGWTHNYNIYLIDESQDIFLADVTGRITRFHKNGSNYVADPGETHELHRVDSDTFLLRELDGSTQTFNRFTQSPWQVAGEFYQLTQITATNGQTTNLSYDELGRLSTITDPFGRRVILSYHASSNLLSTIQNADGAITQIHYTEQNIGRILDPLGNSLEFSYDAKERMLTEKKKDDNTWTCQYNSSGKPQKLIDNEGQVLVTVTNSSNWAVDENELLQSCHVRYVPGQTTVTDGEGNVTHYTYDHNGYITGVQHIGHPETEYQYDENLRLTARTDEKSNTWRYGRDQYGNTTSIEDPLGDVILMLYEHPSLKSLMTKKIEPDDDVWRYVYDSKGNLEQEIDPMVEQLESRIVSHTYDEQGFRTSTTDRNGHVTQWQYHPDGTLAAQIVDPEGLFIVTKYKYDEAGRKTEEKLYRGPDLTDPVTTQYEYDALGRVESQVVDPGGLKLATRYRYDGEGRVTHQTNPKGVTTEYHYDARGRLRKQIDDPGGLDLITEHSYDNAGNLFKLTDPKGNETQYEYDDQNRLAKIIDAEGYWTVYEYDERGMHTHIKRSVNRGSGLYHITQTEYDELSRRIYEIVDPNGLALVTQFEYALAGSAGCACGTPGSSLVHKTIDPAGKITYYYYDKLDRLTHEVHKVEDSADNGGDADDAITRYDYDFMGNPTSVTVENDPYPDMATVYAYDAANRLIKQVEGPGGSELQSTYVYDGAGNLIQESTTLGNIINSVYDKANRMIELGDTIGVITSYTYNENGNTLTQTDGLGRTQSNTYDNFDRRTEMYDPLVETPSDKHITYTYDKNSNLIQQTDNEGLITRYTYDGLNRSLTETCDPGGLDITITQAYDGLGHLIEITDDNGNTTRYEYDAVGRRTREIYADGTDVSFAYDKVGNIITHMDQMDNVTSQSYDDLYRLTARMYSNGHTDTFTYDRAGWILAAENNHSHISFAYDDVGGVVSSTQADRPQSYSYTVQYAYSTSPNERTITYPSGKTVKEVYDVRGRLADVDVDGIKATRYTYDDPSNQVLSRSFANDTHTEYTYNENSWINAIRHIAPDGSTFTGFSHNYDTMGNRLNAINLQSELPPDIARPITLSEKYEYDAINRLVDFKRGSWGAGGIDLPTQHRTWQLDEVGNWLHFSIDGKTFSNSINQMNEYDDWSTDGPAPIPDDDILPDDFKVNDGNGFNYTHDKNGNLVNDGNKEYYYDYEHRPVAQATRRANNQLTLVKDSQTGAILGQYWYDALGRRIRKLVEGMSTIYVYTNDWHVIEEYEDNGLAATYTHGNYIDECLTMERDGETYYYHQNAIRSVLAVTDSTGEVAELYTYDPYGNPSIADGLGVLVTSDPGDTPCSAISNPYLFTGRRFDEEAKLFYYRMRYFDYERGRFLQRDPIGYEDGINLYEYARSAPASFTDPLGLWKTKKTLTGVIKHRDTARSRIRNRMKYSVTIEYGCIGQGQKVPRLYQPIVNVDKCNRIGNLDEPGITFIAGATEKHYVKVPRPKERIRDCPLPKGWTGKRMNVIIKIEYRRDWTFDVGLSLGPLSLYKHPIKTTSEVYGEATTQFEINCCCNNKTGKPAARPKVPSAKQYHWKPAPKPLTPQQKMAKNWKQRRSGHRTPPRTSTSYVPKRGGRWVPIPNKY